MRARGMTRGNGPLALARGLAIAALASALVTGRAPEARAEPAQGPSAAAVSLRAGETPPAAVEARYLAALHGPIHRLWVETVLSRSLGDLPAEDPFHAPGRRVTLRLRFAPGGAIRSATVVKASGWGPFDAVARALALSIPDYPAAPPSLRSDDGDVVVEWTLHRHRPWCHPQRARVVYVPFTETVLEAGDVPRAARLLGLAARQGRLGRYARAFARVLLRKAAASGDGEALGALGGFLGEPAVEPAALPEAVLRGALSGARPGPARRAVLGLIARLRSGEATRVLTGACAAALSRPGGGAGELHAALGGPAAVATGCLAAARKGARGDPGQRSASALVLSWAGSAAERRGAEETLLDLLRARSPEERLAALAALGPRSATPAILARLKAIALGPVPPEPVLRGLVAALQRIGSVDAGRVLMMLSYTRKPWLAEAALHALARVEGPRLARCYRFVSVLRSPRSSTGALREAARGLAARCAAEHLAEVRQAARHPLRVVRQAVAEGLSPAAPKARPLLYSLGASRVTGVRLAALHRLLSVPGAGPEALRASDAASPELRPVLCLRASDRASRAACLARAQGSEWPRLARAYLDADRSLVLPRVLSRLASASWAARLEAAWVLLGVPER